VERRDTLIQEKDQLLTTMYQELSTLKQDDITLGQYDDTFDGMKKAILDRGKVANYFRMTRVRCADREFERPAGTSTKRL
jgi:hypothetical protein